jgi:hypothetical protein
MSTSKNGSEQTKSNGKKTVIRILEELMGEPGHPVKLYLNADDKKRDDDALISIETFKQKRDSEREAWEAGREEREAAAKKADESKFDDNDGENTVDNDNFRTSGNAGFRFQGAIDANAREIIQNIITSANEILRLADLKLFDGKGDPDTVVIYTLDTNYDKTALTGTEKVSVPQLSLESSDLQKTDNSNL